MIWQRDTLVGFSSTGAGTLGQSPRLQQALDDMYEHLVRRCVGLYAGLEQSTFDPPAKSDDDDKQEEDDDAGELPEGEEDDEKNDYDEYSNQHLIRLCEATVQCLVYDCLVCQRLLNTKCNLVVNGPLNYLIGNLVVNGLLNCLICVSVCA
mmetsp:Transcript_1186/g.1805  ORF Transcript_1186/g.1805 Transcript_1186/m.1805 type:complete len:151 (+) Transcript_1186:335-787(+)